MFRWDPRYFTYCYASAFKPFVLPETVFIFKVVRYSDFNLQDIFYTTPNPVAANVQAENNLEFTLHDKSRSFSFQVDPIFIPSFTGPNLFGAGPMDAGRVGWVFPLQSRIEIRVRQVVQGGVAPSQISVTCRGLHYREDLDWANHPHTLKKIEGGEY